MKAIVVRRYGDWREVMRIEDIGRPDAAPGEVVVEVHGVTVNRTRDTQIAGGNYTDDSVLPIIPGMDPSGIVVEIGNAVTGFAKGDRIVVNSRTPCGTCQFCLADNDGDCGNGTQIGIHRPGGYAEFVAAPVANCRAIPDNVPFHEATVFMRHCPTSLQLLDDKAALKGGETVLIMGAGGGLGSTGVQIAKLMGAIVIAAAGADERVQLGLDLGADHGINYRTHDLVGEIMKITDGKGVDVVYENISDPTMWPQAFACLAYAGRLVTAGAHGGGRVEIDIRQLYLKRLKVMGAAGSSRRNLDSALAFAETGRLTCAIDDILPLSRLHEAFDRIAAGTVTGKLVIDPSRQD